VGKSPTEWINTVWEEMKMRERADLGTRTSVDGGMNRRTFITVIGGTGAGLAVTAALRRWGANVAEAAGTIKLAVQGPLSGSNADTGQAERRGVELAVSEINAAGGVQGKQFVVEFFDDEGKPEASASVAQRIVDDKEVFAVVGPLNSSAAFAALPIYQRAGLVLISGDASNPKLTHMGYTNFFRIITNDALEGPELVMYAAKQLGKKRFGAIYENTDYGKGLLDAIQGTYQQFGAQQVAAETYTISQDKDFSAQLTKIKQANPDALLHAGQYGEGGPIFNQAYRLGLTTNTNVAKLGFDGDHQAEFITLGTREGVDGTYLLAAFNPFLDNPRTKAFLSKIQSKFGHTPTEQEAQNYDIIYILKAAIEKGATKETLAQVLHSIKYEGVTGHNEFDANGDVINKPMAIFVVRNGDFAYLGASR